jgi:hypothetical protein
MLNVSSLERSWAKTGAASSDPTMTRAQWYRFFLTGSIISTLLYLRCGDEPTPEKARPRNSNGFLVKAFT